VTGTNQYVFVNNQSIKPHQDPVSHVSRTKQYNK